MLPQFIVVGAEKSGSTFLVHRLMEHPQVYMPSLAAALFLADPLYTGDLPPLSDLFAGARPSQVRGIRRGRYFGHPQSAAFLAACLSDVRLIVILRHPVARAISAYFQAMWFGTLPVKPLNDGFAQLLDDGGDVHKHAWHSIIEEGLYYTNLARYLEHFPREQILVLLLDDFRNGALQEMQKVYRFIGTSESFIPDSLGQSENSGVYSLTRVRVRRYYRKHKYVLSPEGLQLRRQNQSLYQRSLGAVLQRTDRYLLEPFLRQPMPRLSATLAQRLLDLYTQEVEQLEVVLDRALGSWKGWAK
jgi:hypothetical protein